MPEMENVDHGMRFVAVVVDLKRRRRHFANTPGRIMVRASGRYRAQTQSAIDQSFAHPDCRRGIIFSNESDNALEIIKGGVRDQDFVIHEATEPFTSCRG